jgi:glycerophosphodiester phosphodiesterase
LATLQYSEESVEAFLQKQLAIILRATGDLVEKSTLSSLSIDNQQPARYKRCVVELSKFIVRLDLFATLNQDIIRRLVARLTITFARSEATLKKSTTESTRLLYTRPWLQSLTQLNNILKTLQEPTATDTDSDKNDTSLSLEGNQADSIGRSPLHYAAAHGQTDIVSRIVQLSGCTVCLQPDIFGDTPLLLAVLSGHASTVQLFLSSFPLQVPRFPTNLGDKHHNWLALAIESGHEQVAETLIAAKLGLGVLGDQGQSPLYRAARRGYSNLVKLLLEVSVDGDAADVGTQWTPLIVASVYGHTSPVEHLKAYGVDVNRRDGRGWSAVDHASYRGSPKIVEALQPTGSRIAKSLGTSGLQPPATGPATGLPPTVIMDRDSERCTDTEMSEVFVNLGSFNLHWKQKALDLQPYIDRLSPQVLPESNMVLEVQASDCKEEYHIQLPIIGDLGDSPCSFSTATPDTMRLAFRIVKLMSQSKYPNNVVCSGLVILKSLRQGLGKGRDIVGRNHAVPLVDDAGAYAGEMVFSFLICRPFQADVKVPAQQRMQRLSPTVVGGHRGMLWRSINRLLSVNVLYSTTR